MAGASQCVAARSGSRDGDVLLRRVLVHSDPCRDCALLGHCRGGVCGVGVLFLRVCDDAHRRRERGGRATCLAGLRAVRYLARHDHLRHLAQPGVSAVAVSPGQDAGLVRAARDGRADARPGVPGIPVPAGPLDDGPAHRGPGQLGPQPFFASPGGVPPAHVPPQGFPPAYPAPGHLVPGYTAPGSGAPGYGPSTSPPFGIDGSQYYAPATPAAEVQPPPQGSQPGVVRAAGGRVDVNNAVPDQLAAALGGDGALASRIVAARDAHGGFASLDDMVSAARLAPHEFVRVRDVVVFEPRTPTGSQAELDAPGMGAPVHEPFEGSGGGRVLDY
ncbi:hypothetical protein ET495_08000 [Xylanimonas allomyrinae]|uniref:Helix-hairpin-helix domain-containing protein n=1 Tax=Xylanimonas allomyrinae TaxID=2509459 RepID=A0A4P6EKH1_9MICO|nr:helix-hairpin-helix domain-containing protein [Xylanimonas allomyrinae]QAY63190.1 hypothetical protein ET495_08000 [Xylanimonas allomyrinae]